MVIYLIMDCQKTNMDIVRTMTGVWQKCEWTQSQKAQYWFLSLQWMWLSSKRLWGLGWACQYWAFQYFTSTKVLFQVRSPISSNSVLWLRVLATAPLHLPHLDDVPHQVGGQQEDQQTCTGKSWGQIRSQVQPSRYGVSESYFCFHRQCEAVSEKRQTER